MLHVKFISGNLVAVMCLRFACAPHYGTVTTLSYAMVCCYWKNVNITVDALVGKQSQLKWWKVYFYWKFRSWASVLKGRSTSGESVHHFLLSNLRIHHHHSPPLVSCPELQIFILNLYPEDLSWYYPPIYTLVSQVASFPEVA
jgi:hypothetical protein